MEYDFCALGIGYFEDSIFLLLFLLLLFLFYQEKHHKERALLTKVLLVCELSEFQYCKLFLVSFDSFSHMGLLVE